MNVPYDDILGGNSDADTEETQEASFEPDHQVFIDWSHKAEKLAIIKDDKEYEATAATRIFKTLKNSVVYCENMPQKYWSQLTVRGNVIYRCRGNDVSEWRNNHGDHRGKAKIKDIEDCRYIKAVFLDSPQKFRIYNGDPAIKTMQGMFKMLQKARTGLDNQMSAQLDGSKTYQSLSIVEKQLKKAEDEAVKQCKVYLKEYPIWTEYLQHVKGCGPKSAAGIIGHTLGHGIGAFKTYASYAKWFGIHNDSHGLAARRHAGEGALDFSIKRKTLLMGDLAPSLIRTKSEYKLKIYDPYKANLQANNEFPAGMLFKKHRGKFYKEDATKRRGIHMASMAERKMVQIFLEHVYRVWRLIEGHDVRNLYAIDKLGHTTYIKPYFIPESLQGYFDQI